MPAEHLCDLPSFMVGGRGDLQRSSSRGARGDSKSGEVGRGVSYVMCEITLRENFASGLTVEGITLTISKQCSTAAFSFCTATCRMLVDCNAKNVPMLAVLQRTNQGYEED